MNTKFSSIQTNLQRCHTFHEPSPTSPTAPKFPQHPSINRVVNSTYDAPSSGSDTEADDDEHDDAMYDSGVPIHFNERQVDIIRRVMRKWRRLSGLKGAPSTVDELDGNEFQVNWTKAIAPRLEGRIKEVGKGVKSLV